MQKQIVTGVVEKFNIFDIFSMLIPGCITLSAIYISLYPLNLSVLKNMNAIGYIMAIILSYTLGLILHELGRIFDDIILHKMLYGGDLRNTYTSEKNKDKIFKNGFLESYFKKIKEYLMETTNLTSDDLDDRTVFHLCSNALEINGIKKTADKFIAISEMSRSLAI